MRWGHLALLVSWLLVGGNAARAEVRFYTNPFTWADAAQPVVRDFALTAADVLLANEVTSLPGDGTRLPGQNLTFPAAATGFGFDFRLHNLTDWPFTFRTSLAGPLGATGLMAGEPQAGNGSDWEIILTGPETVRGFGFDLIDNEGGPDRVLVYGRDGALVGTSAPLTSQYTFVGVISDVPIGRVVLDGPDGDISAFNDLRLAYIPEPGALTAAAACALLLVRRLRRA